PIVIDDQKEVSTAEDTADDGSGRSAADRALTGDLIASRHSAIDKCALLIQFHAGETDAVGRASFKTCDDPAMAGCSVNTRADVTVRDIILLRATSAEGGIDYAPVRACGVDRLVVLLAADELRSVVTGAPVRIAEPETVRRGVEPEDGMSSGLQQKSSA